MAEALSPFDQATRELFLGNYAEGWRLWESRPSKANPQPRQLRFPEWQGEPLGGKRLLIWPEQGFGDQIMMARFYRRTGAAFVTVGCKPPLARLMRHVSDDILLLAGVPVEVQAHDYWALPMSLPLHLGVTLSNLPNAPYFTATETRKWGRIGVMVRGEPKHAMDRHRSLPREFASELLALPGAISLAPEDTGAADFQDTANIIAGLDVVLTVDTAVAHLAGAMGKPTWLLLSFWGLDWRWMLNRADSPWYPSMRLFRQQTPGDWRSVLDEVLAALG